MRSQVRWWVFALAALLVAGAVGAQETTGAVTGTITSPDGQPLPGVNVVVEHDETALRRVAVTDVDGSFRLPALPPGRYELTATMPSFTTHRQAIAVQLGATSTVTVEMGLGAVTDVVEVTAEQPLIDVTSTVVGITVDAAALNRDIPVAQDTQRLALLAPATLPGDSAFDGADDGTYDQKLVSIAGSSVAENSYQLNGLNITNFRTGVGSSWIPFEFVDEVQVKTGGYEAEFGRSTGGVVNMVTKSGTNMVHGGATAYLEPDSLSEEEANTLRANGSVRVYNQLEEQDRLEGNLSLGGPLLRDRVFFFGFLQYRDTEYVLASGASRAQRQEGAEPYWGGKLDWNISPAHRVEATFFTDATDIDVTLLPITDGAVGSDVLSEGVTNRGGENSIVKYTGIFTENLLVSLQYGTNDFDRTDAATGDPYPYAFDVTGGSYQRIGYWTNSMRGSAFDEREAWRVDVDHFVGDHALRAGFDAEENYSFDLSGYTGGNRYDYQYNEGSFEDLPDDELIVSKWTYEAQGGFNVSSNAAYLQDTWSVTPNLTLNLGVRWEKYENENVNGDAFVTIDDQYAPRLGVVWDPGGRGRSKLYGSYGMYHLPIASNTSIRMAGTELFTITWHTVDGWNEDGTPINLGPLLADPTVYSDGSVPDPRECASENLNPMSQNEFIVGYEQLVGDRWSLGVRGVVREFNDVIEDIGGDYPLWSILGIDIGRWWGVLANPGNDLIAWVDSNGDGELERFHFTAEELGYPEAERNYYAIELTANRRFADHWMLQGSYTWSHSYGNYEGFVDSTIGQSDGGITELFDYPGLMDHSSGNLPNDRRHNLKLFGSYRWDSGLQFGGHLYYLSGRPISGLGVHPTDDWAGSYYAASFFVQGEPTPRGSFGTTDDMWGLDATASYVFGLGGAEASVRFDVFNLLNGDAVTEVDEYGDTDAGGVNPDFLLATKYQPPRAVRFGFGVSF